MLNLKHEREGNQGRREWVKNTDNSSTSELIRMLIGACNTIDKLLDELDKKGDSNEDPV